METWFFIVVWLIGAYVSAVFAEKKGRGPGRWMMVSWFFSPLVAMLLIHILPINVSNSSGFKRCNHCGNAVKKIARKCQYCHSDIA